MKNSEKNFPGCASCVKQNAFLIKMPFHAQYAAATKISRDANFSYVIASAAFAAHKITTTPYVLKFNLKYVSFICSVRKLIWKT